MCGLDIYYSGLPSSSRIVIVVVLAVVLGPSPEGGLTGILNDPRNISLSSSITSDRTESETGMLASSGRSVNRALLPV